MTTEPNHPHKHSQPKEKRSHRLVWLVSSAAIIIAIVALLLSQCTQPSSTGADPTPCPTVTVYAIGEDGANGLSAYELWRVVGNSGTVEDFLTSLVGEPGEPGDSGVTTYVGNNGQTGPQGEQGASAYQQWLDAGNTGTPEEFLESLTGDAGADGVAGHDGPSAYDLWVLIGNTGTVEDFLDSLVGSDGIDGSPGLNGTDGDDGAPGLSAYEQWVLAGGIGNETAFLASLVGASGSDGVCTIGDTGATGPAGPTGQTGVQGLSAYDLWLLNGGTGTVVDFLASLIGADGAPGAVGPAGPQGPQGPSGTSFSGGVGSFWDETTQGFDGAVSTAPDVANPVYLSNADPAVTDGVSVVSGAGDAAGRKSYITFTSPGVYNIAFSAQVYRTQGGNEDVASFWLRKNGVNVPMTNTDVSVVSNSTKLVAAWNFFVAVNCDPTCDQYQLMWSYAEDHTNLWFQSPQTGPTRPGIPSVILTVNQVQ